MLNQATETYVAWATGLLLLGAVLALLGGISQLAGVRRLPYFRLRRERLQRGWQLIVLGLALLLAAGVMRGLGARAVARVNPPTATPTASAPPSGTPAPSLTPTRVAPPTVTLLPSLTPTPSDTSTATASPIPQLPLDFITPPGPVTVTPPTEAAAAHVRLSTHAECVSEHGLEAFNQLPRTIYAHFDFDHWRPGAQWSGVWRRDGAVIFVETQLWAGEAAGCGLTRFNNGTLWWPEGNYAVQIFIGDRWLASKTFVVMRTPPTLTPSNTFTPTVTRTATATRTPRPTSTPTVTRTP